jgi:hypothetical protein
MKRLEYPRLDNARDERGTAKPGDHCKQEGRPEISPLDLFISTFH